MLANRNDFKTCLTILISASIVLSCLGKENISKAQVTQFTNFQPLTSTAAVKLTAANAINISAPKDGLNKRNIKINDLSAASKVQAKSYDPPPEFYRGPGSIPSANTIGSTTAYASLNKATTTGGYNSKPISFPDTIERAKYTDIHAGNSNIGKDYNKRQLQEGYGDVADRISVGHYGSADHSTTHGGSSASFLHGSGISAGYASGGGYAGAGGGVGYGNGYSYDDHGRPSYHNDYDGGPRYPVAAPHAGDAGHSYYIGSHSDEAGGIPFDVYGSKGHYAGAGGEYSYSSYPQVHETAAHKAHGHGHGHGYGYGGGGVDWQHKALLAKSFLIPLASAAVLGIAAAFVSNPLLLQLGTVSGPAVLGKRRKRRDLSRPTFGSLTRQQSAASGQSLAYRHLAHRQHDV